MFWNIIFFSCSQKENHDSADTDYISAPESSNTNPEPNTDQEPATELGNEPASEASPEPTIEPTIEPTQEPTAQPSQEPTSEPQFDFPRLRFELTWMHAGDDMDLHILNGSDASLLFSGEDCYFDNCSNGLDWGVSGDENDNPILIQHDDLGIGPEITIINQPQAGAIYTVYVHDYPESFFEFDHNVTVRIILDDIEVCSAVKTISIENSMTPFFSFDWDGHTCTTL